MKYGLLFFLFFGGKVFMAHAQHYQRIVTAITACKTQNCIDSLRQHYKPLRNFSPVTKEIGQAGVRVLMDFYISPEEKEKADAKRFRLSMFIHQDLIQYGQLEQIDQRGQLETSYLFSNNIAYLNNFVARYNQLHGTKYTYQDFVSFITNRKPNFWIWVN